ncbi:DUF5719 family protein, partial [Actinotalea ferrariae]|uniref:DUF5719 family protein n=1 Tax=Actinotalea ferrariae TaxID=1386098 RepID=UPI0021AB6980
VRTAAGDLRGLAAASCRRPGAEAWLVGGSTSLGSSARLVLQNPGSTPATVDVELWGPAGAVELAGAPEYLVPPGAERVVLLEGVAAEQSRVVVHLSASGGLVTAYLQDSQLRGLVPAGVDYVVPGRAPAQRQVVPALSVTETAIDGADTAALRLLVPGDRDGTARISLLGPDGPQDLPGADEVELDAGAVLDVPLAGLPAGDWTAVVESDVPVVAAALVTRGTGVGRPAGDAPSRAPLDRAWVPSVASGVSGPLALPGGRGVLTLGVATDDDVTGAARAELEVLDGDGASLGTRDLRLAAGTTTSIPLDALLGPDVPAPDPAAVVLRTEDPRIAWGAVLVEPSAAGDLVAALVPVGPARAQPEVLVRLR